MSELTFDEVRRIWQSSDIHDVFQIAGRHGEHLHEFGTTISGVPSRIGVWDGEAGEAFAAETGKQRTDIENDIAENKRVRAAIERAEIDVSRCTYHAQQIYEDATHNHWTVTDYWRIVGETYSDEAADTQQQLQERLDTLKAEAHQADHELAVAIRAAIGDVQLDQNGHEVPEHPEHEGGRETPADQLPLPPKSGNPTPTEGTRDNASPDPGRHLNDNPRPSPLLAGLSAQEWRERLARFQPGDPLPDPRTPTGDKAIDALAHAASQQNTSYAWGGNGSTDGPSRGHKATPQEYPGYTTEQLHQDGSWTNRDDERVGYDCGGLVRYSYQQGAGIEVGQGTYAIDRNAQFDHPAGGIRSELVGGQARPGDILVFGASTPYTGAGTHHTGIYIGNGFMMNAPDSGNPVRVDWVRGHGTTDLLRLPGQ